MDEQQQSLQRKKYKERSDKGQPKITRRDLWLLEWVGDMYAIRVDHLEQLLAWDIARPDKVTQEGKISSKGVLERWRAKYNFVDYRVIIAREPAWVWLTQEGLNAASLRYKMLEPRPQSPYNHWYYNNLVRMWVQQKHPERMWLSERRLKYGKETRKIQQIFDVDAEVRTGENHEKRIAVEVELTAKDDARTLEKMQSLARSDYNAAWYFVTSKTTSIIRSPARSAVLNAWRKLTPRQQEVIFIFDLDSDFARIEA